MKKIVAAFLLLGILFMPSVFAIVPPPPSVWELVFEDTDKIFYMTPWIPSTQSRESFIERYGEERMQLRSGLYYNTDPLVNIYYVDWSFTQSSIFFSKCGIYFAYVHGPSMNWSSAPAVSFFENGSRTKTYLNGDLRHTRGHFWENWEQRAFNQQTNALTIVTAQRRTFTFDITTGEIIRGPIYRPTPGLIVGVVFLAVAGVVFWVGCRRK